MADVTVPAPPPLVDIYGVELIHTGAWPAGGIPDGGLWNATLDDLHQAVAALDCPSVRRPIIKIGHTDPRFDGEPAVGFIDALRVENDQVLVGDYRGLPAWLAAKNESGSSVLASAWPDRSIEGQYGYRCQIGHVHPFVLTAVALLGVAPPAVGVLESLQDVAQLFGVQAAGQSGRLVTATIRASMDDQDGESDDEPDDDEPEHSGAMIALIPTDADAARLAVEGGEPGEQLHVTLHYLGDGADFSPDAREQMVDLVRSYLDADGGLPPVEADGFAVSVFNPGSGESAIVLGLGGAGLSAAHNRVLSAMGDYGADLPEQHDPWVPHLTLTYSDDPGVVATLVDRVGPVVFDRVRLAFAGEHIDIPLSESVQATVAGGSPMSKPPAVTAAVSVEDVRREYYEKAPYSHWITEVQLEPLQLIVVDDGSGHHYRVPVTVSGNEFTFGDAVKVAVEYVDVPDDNMAPAASRIIYASRADTRPTATIPPAAEPDHTTMEDDMPLGEFRQRLGLPDDADEAAVLAAIDELTSHTPDPIAASVTAEAAEWRAEAQRLSGELAEVRARQAEDDKRHAATEKTTFFDGVVASGRLKPAERGDWEGRYDRAPEVTREILTARAAGSEVPVTPAGQSGSTEPGTDDIDAEYDRLFTAEAKA
jgi:2'-5' RNA ligase